MLCTIALRIDIRIYNGLSVKAVGRREGLDCAIHFRGFCRGFWNLGRCSYHANMWRHDLDLCFVKSIFISKFLTGLEE
jgi:hypothetical protein